MGQTAITIVGAQVFTVAALIVFWLLGLPEVHVGKTDQFSMALILMIAFASVAFAQTLWIWAAGRLGILIASMHMNAVPFYVMIVALLTLGGEWSWHQAIGAALVAAGVIISQIGPRRIVQQDVVAHAVAPIPLQPRSFQRAAAHLVHEDPVAQGLCRADVARVAADRDGEALVHGPQVAP